ncbi:hypothetical protein [Pseudogemmobacter hezensis]|uniref:hypothetical protein n=1 Tax=Pseudogemmobacter hezensis TaxID=2737662 RepID=UPI001C12ECB6|nr:hypothetical protein [Pseudogemmobacter hezensis]
MKRQDEERIAALLAKAMAMVCVRNTMLESIHAGRMPVTNTGDFSDVFVIDGDGNLIPWKELSRIDDEEMRDLMRQVVNPSTRFSFASASQSSEHLLIAGSGLPINGTNPNLMEAWQRARSGPEEY